MSQIDRIRQELKDRQDLYVPNQETRLHIKDVTLGMIIGPACVGKSTIIKRVTENNPEFSNPGGFTTRPNDRGGDAKKYRHLENTALTWATMLQAVKAGDPVQYNVYDTGHLYGSEIQDYQTRYSILDTQYSALGNLERAGFRSAIPIGIVCAPAQYEAQLYERFRGDYSGTDAKNRMKEARDSIEWLLDHRQTVAWVINRAGMVNSAAEEVEKLVTGEFRPLASAVSVGERLYKRLRSINAEI